PLTTERWKDLEALFGERGAYDGCLCMWCRLKRPQSDAFAFTGLVAAFRNVSQIMDNLVPIRKR
ncbi:MAG: hypothetical protein U9R12_05240, partial [Candidatus Caldatribacteriota bacterium]|nr:hypothetical protein [Candidatus Caldatribacteriota bacterium]